MEVRNSLCFRYQDPQKHLVVRTHAGQLRPALGRLLRAVSLAILMAEFTIAAPQPKQMDDRAVAKVIGNFFSSIPDHHPGDLITRSQIEKVIAKLVSDGAQITQPSKIVQMGVPDDSFLARELSTPNGKRFMRKISQHPGEYSHLDRLSTIPRGQTIARDLIRQKDGDKLIEYMATTKGGKNLGNMMGDVRGGVDLNKPTGRIYTAEELLTVLKAAMPKP